MWPWIGFPIGVLCALRFPVLVPELAGAVVLACIAWLFSNRNGCLPLHPVAVFICWSLIGAGYMQLRAGVEHRAWTPPLGKSEYWMEAKVRNVSITDNKQDFMSLVAEVETLDGMVKSRIFPIILKLNLYRLQKSKAEVLALHQQGKRFKAKVVLQPLSGMENGVGFDSVAYWTAKGVRGKGYVKELLWVDTYSQIGYQQRIFGRFTEAYSGLDLFPVLIALSLGQKQALSWQQKQELNQMGLSHLFAISGLHITIIFATVLFLFKRLVRTLEASLGLMIGLSLLIVWLYIVLIGLPVSAFRAGIALTLVSVLILIRAQTDWLKLFLSVLNLSLLWQPFAPLNPAWWLSFGAVAMIMLLIKTQPPGAGKLGYFTALLKLQVWIGVALLPLTLIWFQKIYLAGFITNLLAVPVFSFVLIPLCFLSTCLFFFDPSFSYPLFELANLILTWLLSVFRLLDLERLTIDVSSSAFGLVVVACWFWINNPQNSKAIWIVILAIIAPMLSAVKSWTLNKDDKTSLDFYVLDVGQGTSALVVHQNHAFIFDLGPSFGSKFDATNQVLKPLLIKLGIKEIEGIWISHFDTDHRGRLSVLSDWPIKHLQYGCQTVAKKRLLNHTSIEVIWPDYPTEKRIRSSNDQSCVVKFAWQSGAILFPGDISKRVEKKLVEKHVEEEVDLSAAFLLSPHHGSDSSSSIGFIQAVSPAYVFHTNGVNNRYGFPHDTVKARFREMGTKQFETAKVGMIHFQISLVDGKVTQQNLQLDKWTPFWKRQNPFSIHQQIR